MPITIYASGVENPTPEDAQRERYRRAEVLDCEADALDGHDDYLAGALRLRAQRLREGKDGPRPCQTCEGKPSEDEVERVAEALAEEFGYTWGDVPECWREYWRNFARRLLAIARGEME